MSGDISDGTIDFEDEILDIDLAEDKLDRDLSLFPLPGSIASRVVARRRGALVSTRPLFAPIPSPARVAHSVAPASKKNRQVVDGYQLAMSE